MEKPEGYPEVGPQDETMLWPSAKNDMSFLESGVLRSYYNGYFGHHDRDYDYYYSLEESEFGKFSDPRLLALVEFFRELYFRRKELFKELFPRLQDQFQETLKKSGVKMWRVKSGNNRTRFATMQRSLSLGSPSRGNEWIKVKTINTGSGAGAGDDQQGQGSGSK